MTLLEERSSSSVAATRFSPGADHTVRTRTGHVGTAETTTRAPSDRSIIGY
jgi:hypothetical protein